MFQRYDNITYINNLSGDIAHFSYFLSHEKKAGVAILKSARDMMYVCVCKIRSVAKEIYLQVAVKTNLNLNFNINIILSLL